MAAVILDVDGTLVDSNDAHAHAWVEAFAEAGITVDYDTVRRCIGMGGDKLMPAVSGLDEGQLRKAGESPSGAERFSSRRICQPCVPCLEPASCWSASSRTASSSRLPVRRLKTNCSRCWNAPAVPTSSRTAPRPTMRTIRNRIPTSCRRRCVKHASRRAARSCWGTHRYDVEAALRAGIGIVALECGGWSREELTGAAAVFRDLTDLLVHYDASPFATLRTF